MFIAVDLPEPLGPMIATNSPSSMVRSTPRSASTAAAPRPYVLWSASRRMRPAMAIGSGRVAGVGDDGVAVADVALHHLGPSSVAGADGHGHPNRHPVAEHPDLPLPLLKSGVPRHRRRSRGARYQAGEPVAVV